MKIGLDIHGVIDKHPKIFSKLSIYLKEKGHEVHILTGPPMKRKYRTHRGKFDTIEEELEYYGIVYDNIFSIVTYNLEIGSEYKRDSKGNFFFDDVTWNKTKSIYCSENNIDLHIDDTKEYGEYFKTPFAYLGTYKSGKSFIECDEKTDKEIIIVLKKFFRGVINFD